jgi:hypothetical protein
MAVETQQLPVTAVRGIVVMVMVFMMDGELVEFFPVKFTSAVRANPGKQFKRKGSIRLIAMKGGAPCHDSLREMTRRHIILHQALKKTRAIHLSRSCSALTVFMTQVRRQATLLHDDLAAIK